MLRQFPRLATHPVPVRTIEAFAITGKPSTLPKRTTVYVVDDHPSMLRSVRRLLRAHGFQSVLFHTAEALQNNGKFDRAFCIILDINLGDGSGIELRHGLAVAGVTLPVIYITGNYSEATRMAAIESGCLAYLTKPFTATSLIQAVENASAILA